MKPTIGRIVHFVSNGTDHYAAIVTHVWSGVCVNLFVFPKGRVNDGEDSGVKTSVVQDEAGTAGHSWHWPASTDTWSCGSKKLRA